MSVQFKDYYEILGVSRSATEKEIKSAYRKLAREYHPDVNPNAGDKFKEINEAYEALGDPDKRKRYDQLGQYWRQGGGMPGAGGGGYGGYAGPGGQQFSSLEELLASMGMSAGGSRQAGVGGSGFSDFFDVLFGGMAANAGMGGMGGFSPHSTSRHGRGTQRTAAPSPPPPASEQEIWLTLEEVLNGTERSMMLSETRKNITVNIPKGVEPGKKIRIKGGGKAHPQTGQAGDLHLVVRYQPHADFEVDGRNLVHTVELPVYDLVLGTEVKVPMLGGGHGTLPIPPGAQPGQSLRLKHQGLPDSKQPEVSSARGHLLVKLKGILPKAPSEAEKALYQNLKTLVEHPPEPTPSPEEHET